MSIFEVNKTLPLGELKTVSGALYLECQSPLVAYCKAVCGAPDAGRLRLIKSGRLSWTTFTGKDDLARVQHKSNLD